MVGNGFLIFFYSLHCWVSFSGFAEVYYDYCRHFKKQNDFDDLWTKQGGIKMNISLIALRLKLLSEEVGSW